MVTAETLQLLQCGTIDIEGLLPWSSNYSFLVRICGENIERRVVYKPQRGERPLWDFTQGTLCLRERAAYLVSDALGWHLVPPTILREGPHGFGSMQLFIEHDPETHYFTFEGMPEFRKQLQSIVLFDILINNADRKSGHVLVEDEENTLGKLWCIDHGVCFHTDYKLRTVIWEFVDQKIPSFLITDLLNFKQQLQSPTGTFYTELKDLLTKSEIRAMQRRLDKILTQKRFPQPGPGRHYPWPPV